MAVSNNSSNDRSPSIFLSYKSEDANLVRLVAEYLIAGGLDVWFNEYQILPENYERFTEAIDEGIRQATHAVVFTNNRWSRADWCLYEMKGLLRSIADRSRIVEVCIPYEDEPRHVFQELLERAPVIVTGDSRDPSPKDMQKVVREPPTG